MNTQDRELRTEFLAEKTAELLEEHLLPVCPEMCSIASDIFFIGEKNELPVADMIKERLQVYLDNDEDKDDATRAADEALIKRLDLSMERDPQPDFAGALSRFFDSLGAEAEHGIAAYIQAAQQELGAPRASYRIKDDEHSNFRDLIGYYTYSIFDISFVEFEGYMLMLVFGSDE